jgi:hypothetical protein
MKKALLLLLVVGVWGSSQAQSSASGKPKTATASPFKIAQERFKASLAAEKKSTSQPSSSSLSKRPHRIGNPPPLPPLGSSANVNGVRDATTTATTANQACNLLVMTHREDNTKVGTCGTGAYEAAYSVNGGASWDTSVVISCNQSSRYPNGALYNPTGNTNPMNVYDAMTGPWTNSATSGDSWVETVYESVTIGDLNDHEMYWTNGNPGVFVQNTGNVSYMSSSDNGAVHVIGEGFNVATAGTYNGWLGAVLTTGQFDAAADSFVWTQKVFWPHLVPSEKAWYNDGGLTWDSLAAPLATPGTAWSQDGLTGYVVIFGNLDSDGYNYASDQPIVYKTTNAGATWAMMPPFNFSTIPSLTTYLYAASDSAVKVPLFYTFVVSLTGQSYAQGANNDYDMTVDMNGNLHIFSAVLSSAYSRADSGYTLSWYLQQHGYIYDVTTNGSSGWTARYVDSMLNFPTHVVTASSDWDATASSSVAFGNRLQASRTYDGTHIFCTWLDDTVGVVLDSITNPDVKGEGYDVSTSTAGPKLWFTNTGINYYACVSDIAMVSGSGPNTVYTIPTTITYPEATPSDGSEPVNYFYLGSVMYNSTLGISVGIPAVTTTGFSISPNYPNPFSNVTYFDVNLTKESTVTVDVYNLLGEKVSSIGSQNMGSGAHKMTINANGWNAGVYFYKVTVDQQSVTQKMMVK